MKPETPITMMMTTTTRIVLAAGLLTLGACDSGGDAGNGEGSTEPAPVEEVVLALEGSNWQLTNMIVQGGFTFTPDDPGEYRLNFRSENRLTGQSDCNNITGNWFQESDALSFEPLAITRYLCPPGSLHNYHALYLRDVQTASLRDGNLILNTSIDEVELEYQRRE
jgi:heat shock protein HslJ